MTLIIVRGLSGSGKSTWTTEYLKTHERTVRVSRDKIRELLFGSEEDYGIDEHLVSVLQSAGVVAALDAGYDVVVDNTNVAWEHVTQLANLAKTCHHAVEIVEIECTLDEAQKRNRNRGAMGGRFVPPHVIDNQHKLFEQTKGWRV